MSRLTDPTDLLARQTSFRLGGSWVVHPDQNVVIGEGREIGLEPKVMAVLLCLASRAGRVVSHAELLEIVWADTVVHPKVLSRAISELRKAFSDDRGAPAFIETIPKRGYRLIAPVETAPAAAVRARRSRHVRRTLGAALLALLAVLYLGLRHSPANRAKTASGTRVPLTTYPGSESDPSYSPNGQRIAFSWEGPTQDNPDIYIMNRGGGVPMRLTEDAGADLNPTWSPDGGLIAFTRHERGIRSLHLVRAGGGPARKVLENDTDLLDALSWSPDGAYLAYADRQTAEAPFEIYLLALNTGESTAVTAPPDGLLGDTNPAFSPDGRYLAFIRTVQEATQYVYTIRLDDHREHQVTRESRPILDLAWSQDSEALFFSSSTPGRDGVWRIPARGGEARQVLTTDGPVLDLDSAPDGEALAFTTARPTVSLWQQNLSGGDPTLHPLSSTRWDSNPAPSPDGSWIAFASARTGSPEIWMCRWSGDDCLQVTYFEDRAADAPAWSPDGRRLAFELRDSTQSDLYVVDVFEGTPRPVTLDLRNDRLPAWSPDGKALYYTSDRSGGWEVWKKPLGGGPSIQITRQGGFAVRPATDDQTIYYTKYGQAGLWKRSKERDEERLLTADLAARDWGNWALYDGGLYYLARRPDTTAVLMYLDPGTGEGREGTRASPEWVPDQRGLAIAPDGSWILFARTERTVTDIIEVTIPIE